MRTEEIRTPIPEGSDIPFKITFKNSNGVPSSPLSITWDLTALDGTVIAYNQSVSSVSSVSYFTLSQANTRILQGETGEGERLLTLHITYLSLQDEEVVIRKQIKFTIQDLKLVGYPIDVTVVDGIFTDDYVQDLGVA